MVLGYIKSIEAVLAVILVVFMLAQVQPVYDTSSKWDEVNLQQSGESALLTLGYTGELRQKIHSGDYVGLNSSIYKIMPEHVKFNLFRNGQKVISNGESTKTTSIVYFLSGNYSYSPSRIEMQLWYYGD